MASLPLTIASRDRSGYDKWAGIAYSRRSSPFEPEIHGLTDLPGRPSDEGRRRGGATHHNDNPRPLLAHHRAVLVLLVDGELGTLSIAARMDWPPKAVNSCCNNLRRRGCLTSRRSDVPVRPGCNAHEHLWRLTEAGRRAAGVL